MSISILTYLTIFNNYTNIKLNQIIKVASITLLQSLYFLVGVFLNELVYWDVVQPLNTAKQSSCLKLNSSAPTPKLITINLQPAKQRFEVFFVPMTVDKVRQVYVGDVAADGDVVVDVGLEVADVFFEFGGCFVFLPQLLKHINLKLLLLLLIPLNSADIVAGF